MKGKRTHNRMSLREVVKGSMIIIFSLALILSPFGNFSSLVHAAEHVLDDGLREAINEELKKTDGSIDVDTYEPTINDLESLDELNADSHGIVDLTGLEHAINLSFLDLYDNEINDLSPLAGLTNLKFLDLGQNGIVELTPLAGLINLEVLYLDSNEIEDISALGSLTNLKELYIKNNRISDLSPLKDYFGNLMDGSLYDQVIELPELELLINSTIIEIDNPVIDYYGEIFDGIDVDDGSYDVNSEIIKWEGLTGSEDTRTFTFDDGGIYGFSGTVTQPIKWMEMTEVELATPEFTEATCDVSEVGVSIPEQEGVNFQIQGTEGAGETITIMAQPDEYVTLVATDGWTIDDGYGFYEHTFEELGDCEKEEPEQTEVELPTPEFAGATCDVPEVDLSTPEQDGVTYQVNGDLEAGSTITIIAQPGENVTLVATEGWTIDDNYGFYEYTFDELGDCEQEEPTKPDDPEKGEEQDDGEKLPNTATTHFNMMGVGLLTLLFGGISYVLIRRRAL